MHASILGFKLAGAPALLRIGADKPLSLERDDVIITVALPQGFRRLVLRSPHTVITDAKHGVIAQLRDHALVQLSYGSAGGRTALATVSIVSSSSNRLLSAASHFTHLAMRAEAERLGVAWEGPVEHVCDMAAGDAEAVQLAMPTVKRTRACILHVLLNLVRLLPRCIHVVETPLLACGGGGGRKRSRAAAAAAAAASAALAGASSEEEVLEAPLPSISAAASSPAATSSSAAASCATLAQLQQQQRKSLLAGLAALITVADVDVLVAVGLGIISRHHADEGVMSLLLREPYCRLAELAAAGRPLCDGVPATSDAVESVNRLLGHGKEKVLHYGGAVIRVMRDLFDIETRAADRDRASGLRRSRAEAFACMSALPPPCPAEIARRAAASAKRRSTLALSSHASAGGGGSSAAGGGGGSALVPPRGSVVSMHPPSRIAAWVSSIRAAEGPAPAPSSLPQLAAAGASELTRPASEKRGVRAALFAAVAPSVAGASARLAAFCSSKAIAYAAGAAPSMTALYEAWRLGFRLALSEADIERVNAELATVAASGIPDAISRDNALLSRGVAASRACAAAAPAALIAASTLAALAEDIFDDDGASGSSAGGVSSAAASSASLDASAAGASGASAGAYAAPVHSALAAPLAQQLYSELPSYRSYIAHPSSASSSAASVVRSVVYTESEREYAPHLASEMRRLGKLPHVIRAAVSGCVFGFRPVDLSTEAPAGRPPIRTSKADKSIAAASLIAVEMLGGARDDARAAAAPPSKRARRRAASV